MTQRSERWLIVGACFVFYALAMGAFVLVTDQPVRWVVDWLTASVGDAWALLLLAVPPLAAGIWGMWPGPDQKPVRAANANWPRWVRIVGNTYLALLGIGLVVAFAAIAIAG